MKPVIPTRIGDLKNNDLVQGCFLVSQKLLLWTREGKPYLKLTLMDSTGQIEAILWENADLEASHLAQGDVVAIKGMVGEYQRERRIKLNYIALVPEDEVHKENFLPTSPRDQEEMRKELHHVIRTIRNPYLKRLLKSIFHDPSLWEAFRKAPAGKSLHHSYIGGLLEHTLSLARLCSLALQNYAFLDHDLVLSGVLLHDLGKAWELSSDVSFEYTDEGQLLGHILLGIEVIERKIAGIPEFPKELAMLVKHMVASHHGETEFGSPKQPMILEALFLHKLDDLDAKLWGVHAFIQRHPGEKSRWTPYHRIHERYFYISAYLGHSRGEKEKARQASEEDVEEGSDPDLFERERST